MLLDAYDAMFAKVVAAKRSRVPYTLTFRRAPFHRGWLSKRARHRSGRRLSGATGWKRRYFVLAYGVFAYYDDVPSNRRATKRGSFALEASSASP